MAFEIEKIYLHMTMFRKFNVSYGNSFIRKILIKIITIVLL